MIIKQNRIIGIDIDDTITDSSEAFIRYARKYNEENGIIFPIDITQMELSKAFGWNNNNHLEFLETYLKMLLKEVKPKEDAVDVIKMLKDEGFKIILITARHERELEDPYEFTKEWLRDKNIHYDKLIVNCKKKELACMENGVEVFIDDSIKNCMDVYRELHIPVMLFNSRYNKDEKCQGINRVYSWNEVYTRIKELYMRIRDIEDDIER